MTGEFLYFALALLEFCLALLALAFAFWLVTLALSELWAKKADETQFYLWLAKESSRSNNSE